jgi:ketosteroid isomerase-like protein
VNGVELVRAFFANAPDDFGAVVHDPRWLAATEQAIGPLIAPSFEFVTVQQSIGLPETRTGIEGFFAAYQAYSQTWTSFHLELERVVEAGDKVIAELTLKGITRTGGVPLEQQVAAVYTFEDGKIRRIEEFSDVASAHAAVNA